MIRSCHDYVHVFVDLTAFFELILLEWHSLSETSKLIAGFKWILSFSNYSENSLNENHVIQFKQAVETLNEQIDQSVISDKLLK